MSKQQKIKKSHIFRVERMLEKNKESVNKISNTKADLIELYFEIEVEIEKLEAREYLFELDSELLEDLLND